MGRLDAGCLAVNARFVDGRLTAIAVKLRRPPVACLFVGLSPASVLQRVPLLFNLCARAQLAAASAALAAAGAAPGTAPGLAEDRALWSECLHEHLWRLLIDWPRALGLPDDAGSFAAWRKARGRAGFETASVATVAAAVDGGVIEKCRQALGGSDRLGARGEVLAPEAWLAVLREPTAPLPTPAFPRSLAAAHAQRVAALQAALAGLCEGKPYPIAWAGAAGTGVGQTATARGVLTHAAEMRHGSLVGYHVWAPTDRLFADTAALTQLVAEGRWGDAGAARSALERAVLALDPCLPYQVEVSDA